MRTIKGSGFWFANKLGSTGPMNVKIERTQIALVEDSNDDRSRCLVARTKVSVGCFGDIEGFASERRCYGFGKAMVRSS